MKEARDEEAVVTRWERRHGALTGLDPHTSFKLFSEAQTCGLAASDLPVPATVPDEVVLEREIGRGGMGVVWQGFQASLRRQIAVKTLQVQGGTSTAAQQDAEIGFTEEALVCGFLEHPNIVPVHCLTRVDGTAALVMKFVDGRPWSALIAEHPEDLEMHLEILLQLCNAVAFAHSRGVIHNDLKPDNVMVGPFGEVLLMDWGVAVAVGQAALDRGIRAAAGLRGPCGTPCYMAPELANGDGPQVGAWTDVYLLGGILYRILSGRPPHLGSSFADTLVRAACARKEPLPEQVPDELRSICLRAMQPAPVDRYPRVEPLQRALREHQRHRQSLDLCTGAWRLLEQTQVAPGGGMSEVARQKLYALYANALGGFTQARKLWADNPAAVQGEWEARRMFARAALEHRDLAVAEVQLEVLKDGPHGLALRRVWAHRLRQRRLRRALAWLCLVLVGVVLLALAAQLHGARARVGVLEGRLEDSRDERDQLTGQLAASRGRLAGIEQNLDALGLALLQRVPRRLLPRTLRWSFVYNRLRATCARLAFPPSAAQLAARGALLQREGQREAAVQTYQAALACAQDREPEFRARLWSRLGQLQPGPEGLAALERAWQLLEPMADTLAATERVALAVDAAYALARRERASGLLTSADAHLAAGLALCRPAQLAEALVLGLQERAELAVQGGNGARAQQLLHAACDAALKPRAGPLLAGVLARLGEVELGLGAVDRAQEAFAAGLETLAETASHDRARCQRGLGQVAERGGDAEQAGALYAASLETLRELARPAAGELVQSLRLLADWHVLQGSPEAALPLFREAVDRQRSLESEALSPSMRELLARYGRTCRARQEFEPASRAFAELAAYARVEQVRDPSAVHQLLALLANLELEVCEALQGHGAGGLQGFSVGLEPDSGFALPYLRELLQRMLGSARELQHTGQAEAAAVLWTQVRSWATRRLSTFPDPDLRLQLSYAQLGEAQLAWQSGDVASARARLQDVRANRSLLGGVRGLERPREQLDLELAELEELLRDSP